MKHNIPNPKFCCIRCRHQWVPRTEEIPKVCPKCKSPYWNTPQRK